MNEIRASFAASSIRWIIQRRSNFHSDSRTRTKLASSKSIKTVEKYNESNVQKCKALANPQPACEWCDGNIYARKMDTNINCESTHTNRSICVSHRLLAITLVVIDYELIHINSDHPSKYTFERTGSTIRTKDCKQLPHLSHSSAVLPFELTKLAFCFCETQLNLTLFKKTTITTTYARRNSIIKWSKLIHLN